RTQQQLAWFFSFFLLSSFVAGVPFASFLHRSSAPHPLHSFPTRRSSDLSAALAPLRHPISVRRARLLTDVRADFAARAQRADSRDRKSTRLNSSHQIISYAVFCLKKKNTKRIAHTTTIDSSHHTVNTDTR